MPNGPATRTQELIEDVLAHREDVERAGETPRDFRAALAWLKRPLYLLTGRWAYQRDLFDRWDCSVPAASFAARVIKEGARHGIPLYLLRHDLVGEDLHVAVLHGGHDERLPDLCWVVVSHLVSTAARRTGVDASQPEPEARPWLWVVNGGAVTCNGDFGGLSPAEVLRRVRRLGRARV